MLFFQCSINWKHLHGRGEDMLARLSTPIVPETPPRTWRRPSLLYFSKKLFRNTSTDVEKTPGQSQGDEKTWKHLHGRGED